MLEMVLYRGTDLIAASAAFCCHFDQYVLLHIISYQLIIVVSLLVYAMLLAQWYHVVAR